MIDTYRLPASASVPYVPRQPSRAERLATKRRREAANGEHIANIVLSLVFLFLLLWGGVQFIKFLWFL
jgi:hypothetical protein